MHKSVISYETKVEGHSRAKASREVKNTAPRVMMYWKTRMLSLVRQFLETQEQWLHDRTTCYNETEQRISDGSVDQSGVKANSVDGPMCRAFNACLAARGYTRSDATGALTIPEDASVQCATPST